MQPGQQIVVMWQGKPVFVRHRTEAEIAAAARDDYVTLKDPALDVDRVRQENGSDGKPGIHHPASQLHALGLRADVCGRVAIWRLVLPVPRLGLRHVRSHSPRAGAAQSLWWRRTCSSTTLPISNRLSGSASVSGPSTYEPKTGFTRWLDKRLPIIRLALRQLRRVSDAA